MKLQPHSKEARNANADFNYIKILHKMIHKLARVT